MALINYLDLDGLQLYDKLIKTLIAESFKSVSFEGDTIKFYRTVFPGIDEEPAAQITINSVSDTSVLMQKIENPTEGNLPVINGDGSLADSGISTDEVSEMIDTVNDMQSKLISFDIINN